MTLQQKALRNAKFKIILNTFIIIKEKRECKPKHHNTKHHLINIKHNYTEGVIKLHKPEKIVLRDDLNLDIVGDDPMKRGKVIQSFGARTEKSLSHLVFN